MTSVRRRPFRLTVGILAVCSFAALASCGSSGNTPASGKTSAQLLPLLLTTDEIPAFGTTSPTGWNSAPMPLELPPLCPTRPLVTVPASGHVKAGFQPQISSGPGLFEQILYTKNAAAEFKSMSATLHGCKKFTVSLAANPLLPLKATFHGTLQVIPFPAYGNESIATLQTLMVPNPGSTIQQGNLLTGSVLVRKGNYLVLVAFTPGTTTFMASQLEPYVNPALNKIPG